MHCAHCALYVCGLRHTVTVCTRMYVCLHCAAFRHRGNLLGEPDINPTPQWYHLGRFRSVEG